MDSKLENHRSYAKFGNQAKISPVYRVWHLIWLAVTFLVTIIFRVAIAFIWVAAHALWIVGAILGGFIIGAMDANSPANFRRRQREKGDYRWG